jgi:hypothetical protein
LFVEIHLLNRHGYVRAYLVCCVHTTRGTKCGVSTTEIR